MMQLNLFTPQKSIYVLNEPHFFDQKTSNPFSENLLQKIWEEHSERFNPLLSLNNEFVFIDNPGRLNKANGPDFEFACLRDSKGIQWHGAIEFHLKENDWFRHQHQFDANYDQVIAHIFLEKGPRRASNAANHIIPFHIHLNLENKTTDLLSLIPSQNKPICSPLSNEVPVEIWDEQIHKASRIYFNQLCARFSTLDLQGIEKEKAHKEKMILQLWSHLGIPHNREWMIEYAQNWLNGAKGSSLQWKTKGNRATEKNLYALKLAETISKKIADTSFTMAKITQIEKVLTEFEAILSSEQAISNQLKNRLMRFVFLPSVAALINQQTHNELMTILFRMWLNIRTPLPNQISNYFEPVSAYHESKKRLNSARQIGWLAQKRFFCTPKKCSACWIIKNEKEILTTD